MFSANTMPCSIVRVCKHTETVDITYRHTREREAERRQLSNEVCSECSNRMKAFFNNPGETAADLELPPLKGSDKQIAWALKIRADRWKLYGNLLHQVSLADPEDPIALPLYKSLLAYAGMTSAKFWIDGRDFKPSFWGLKRDTEFFLKEPGYGTNVGEFSPYGRLKQFDPTLLSRIMNATLPGNAGQAQQAG